MDNEAMRMYEDFFFWEMLRSIRKDGLVCLNLLRLRTAFPKGWLY